MERTNSLWKPILRTCCEYLSKIHSGSPRSEPLDQSFLIVSSLLIAESGGILQGLNSSLLVTRLLLQLLEIRRAFVTVSYWFPLGIGVICEVGSKRGFSRTIFFSRFARGLERMWLRIMQSRSQFQHLWLHNSSAGKDEILRIACWLFCRPMPSLDRSIPCSEMKSIW